LVYAPDPPLILPVKALFLPVPRAAFASVIRAKTVCFQMVVKISRRKTPHAEQENSREIIRA
jgi:hypothetical protein